MKNKVADNFFNDIDFVSIVSTIKGIFTSDGAMSSLLDFERVLDEADLYAYKNWQLGELVQGPDVKRYSVTCTFMWPYHLMPDPRGVKRLLMIGCDISFAKSEIKVPVEIKNYDDFVPGTRYPKMHNRPVWFVQITIPKDLMNNIKEGTIDLADQTIDLQEIEDAYAEIDYDHEIVKHFKLKKKEKKSSNETIDLIKKLADLHSAGILTENEFLEKKKELLSKI
jgi:hypothetical protein